MLLVEEKTINQLAKAMEGLKSDPGNVRCLRFSFPEDHAQADVRHVREVIAQQAQRYLGSLERQLFLCEDGDIFMLAPFVSTRVAQTLIADVAAQLKIKEASDFARLYRLDIQFDELFKLIKDKQVRAFHALEAEELQKVREQDRQKRAKILNPPIPENQTQTIAERRRKRAIPECMLIEDDAFMRRLVEGVLRKNYHLTSIPSADTALIAYIAVAPDILFLDIGLPDVNGHELLKRMLEIDPEAFIIMLSANADMDNVKRALEAGAKGFIAKPFTSEKIIQYIKRCPTIKH